MILTHLLLAAVPQAAAPAPPPIPSPAQDPQAGAPTTTGGQQNSGLFGTDIWFYFPTEGYLLTPVLIVGPNLGPSPTVNFGNSPSFPIFTLNTPELPLIGTIGLTVPLVPIYFFPGTVNMTVEGACGTSPPYPFKLL